MENLDIKVKYTPVQLKRIGLHLLSLIRDRTLRGIDKDGKEFVPYSKNPFGMPYAASNKPAVKELIKQGKAVIFTSKNNKKWVLFKTGYLDYKKLLYKDTTYDGTVNLTGTGRMLANLGVLENSDNKIVLGFTNIQMAERAGFNAMRGRHFLGFSDKDFADTRLKELLSSGFDLV